jgi:dihydrofolate synthase/folylpolyglutamate synthase
MTNSSTKYEQSVEKLGLLGPELRVGKVSSHSGLRKFSLDHIRTLLKALGERQRGMAAVLIAGTNGKGSTAATLASIANAAGLRTGLYTSPHLLRVNERMRVSAPCNGQQAPQVGRQALAEIGDEAFGENYLRVDAEAERLVDAGELPHAPSFFEMLTAVALVWFAEQKVELAVLEVGLGGRLDATNIVHPLVSVITDIGMDHMEYLGDTIGLIAAEKAGILREEGVLVTLSQHPEANAAIGEAAIRLNVRGVDAARCLPGMRQQAMDSSEVAGASPLGRNRYDLSIDGAVIAIDSPLVGQHQQRNLALAVAAAIELRTNHGFAIANEAIERGVRETDWPGRLEWIAPQPGTAGLLLDVAHNPAGAWALRAALAQLPEPMPRTLIFSCLADKPIEEMAQVLLPLFDAASGDPLRKRDHVVLAPIQNPRAATLEQLEAAAARLGVPAHAAPHVPAALAQAQAVTPADGIIVATGSVYLVGELRALALGQLVA